MLAKVFDPFTEDAVNAWLATTPVKVIYKAEVFDSAVDGQARQVALVFYEEEQEMGLIASAKAAHTSPLFDLLEPVFHPERRRPSGPSSAIVS